MNPQIKIDLVEKYNEIIELAYNGKDEFTNQLCNFLVNEFEFQAAVFFKYVSDTTFQVIGRSSNARKNYLVGSEFSSPKCKEMLDARMAFNSDSERELQISEFLVYEIAHIFEAGSDQTILIKLAQKDSFSKTDLEEIEKISRYIKTAMSIWVDAKGGTANVTSKPFNEIVSETALGLRNPTNSIIGFISILNEDNLSSSQADYAQTIKRHAQELLTTINDLLDLTKFESGKLLLEKKQVNVKSFVEDTINTFEERKNNTDIRFEFSADESTNKVLTTDPQKLRYVLNNMVNASITFVKSGKISVKVEKEEDSVYKFTISSPDGGFAFENPMQVFKPFEITKLDPIKDSNITGLSFTLLAKYIKMLGGDYTFTTSHKTGFKFQFTIKGESMSPMETTISKLPKPNKESKVLVIEDDYATSKLLSNYLNKWGYQPTIVNSEEQTLEIIEKENFLAIILDVELPDTNGLELLKKLNEHPRTKNTPVIVAAVEADQQKAYMLGAVEYFVKPINYNFLVEVLTSYKLRKDSKILCVDDDLPTLNLIEQAITTAGFNPIAENISAKVMDRIMGEDIDLAIVDLDMPYPNGFELIKLIKSEPKFSNLPIIIYTGKENFDEDLKQIDGMFEELLSKKSTNIEDLQGIINSMINSYETPPPAEEVIEKKDDSVIKILLAEDYKHSQIIVTRLLKKNGYENIVVVDNGEDAWNYAKKETFNLILMDMQMPIMNGFEATENIRQLPGYQDTPIIALTAFAMKGDREKCLEAGATDYIPKPIDSKEFIEKVKHYTKA